MSQTPPSYVLGHSQEELERLGRQAALVDPITRRFFERAGIGSGMRVLDVGTGAGHVAMIAAELVGATGQVLSVDRSATALETAQARIDAAGLKHVSLLEGDPATMDFEATFDAVVGRYVLMFQPDPVALLRGVARHVRPGGIVVFHEPDWSGVRTLPSVPLYEEACRWIVDTIDKNATESHMGMKLHATFIAAGLPPPEMGLESIIAGGEDMERIRFITEIVGTLQESIVKAGVASKTEIGLENLAERIAKDAVAKKAVLASRSEVGAWARLPR